MIEKDIEYSIKNLILSTDNTLISITNEFSTDGIVRYDSVPIGLLEFKLKRNLQNEKTMSQIFVQAMCYYCKLIEKEKIDYTKPFYIIIGDENEIALINIHKFPSYWLRNPKWTKVAPSKALKEEDLLEVASSMLKLAPPIYYHYDDVKELTFGFYLLFKNNL